MRTGYFERSRAFLIAVLVVAGAFVAIDSALAAPPERPFHANLQVIAHPGPGETPCDLVNPEDGWGVALHLGIVKWRDYETVHFVDCANGTPTSPIIMVHSNDFTLIAANGDEIHGIFTTSGTLDPQDGVAVQGKYQFVSGTGRFAQVSGRGTISAYGGAASSPIAIGSLDGTIAY